MRLDNALGMISEMCVMPDNLGRSYRGRPAQSAAEARRTSVMRVNMTGTIRPQANGCSHLRGAICDQGEPR